jgi:ATP-dependent RNA helicase DDX21
VLARAAVLPSLCRHCWGSERSGGRGEGFGDGKGPDVGSGGRVIVFTETKNDASELSGALKSGTAQALHKDIPQNQREVTLQGFRSGKFSVLVATDVAARGLDINDVQLVVQCEPPRDVETYIHRSGRTGRAGNTGISVLFFDRKKEYMIPQIERKAGFRFERIAAPQPADIDTYGS